MTRPNVPISERINPVGYTPDPDNPGGPGIPGLPGEPERPFDWRPEIPERGPSLFTPCRMRLKPGCYQISMEHTGSLIIPLLRTLYLGTMRVDNGSQDTTISGDVYRFRPFRRLFPDRPYLSELVFADASDGVGPIIPIYPRNRYYSYLKVVDIRKSLIATPHRPCTITLTVEEFRYTHPDEDDATGSFPETPNRVLTIVLRTTSIPTGYPGPSFQGDVFEGGTRLPYRFSMHWVSDFFRRAKLELENVVGVAIPGATAGNDFRSIYAAAGWDLTVVNGDANLAVPAGVSATNPWSNAELHEFMVDNRNSSTDLDKEWQFYHASVPFDASISGIFGIMFDQLEDQREGACNFIQNFSGLHNDDRAKLRSAAHEIGHGFNQLHPPTEGLSSDNSIMTQSGPVRSIIEAAGGTYPDDINFAFNEHNRHHMNHFPDVVVRPGGEDFEFGHDAGFAPEAEDHADAAGLELHLAVDNSRLKLGEPLTLRIELMNNGSRTVRAPKHLGTAFHVSEISVRRAGGESRRYRSFVLVCDSQDYQELKPGQKVTSQETIYWDRNGCLFHEPGMHTVSATLHWDDRGEPFAVKSRTEVWVNYPVTEAENQVAALLLDDEVGKYIALGGNARHLKKAVARIEQAAQVGKGHPAVQRIMKLNEAGKKPRSGR